ncbi:helix-turn-helix transcriptional regulator [Brachybacterium huguangmaarense]|uniref:Helix-turn-helix transcriptional regulator n=1 Tax=Brachybacterium huguangmaarense TaxID=1652028 RepID=A0ABY6G4S9_9MICO|nr:helix-turn-helix transcriptional regulator [Brachybacterium huguangmaarense]UYG18117.1 helix-turn-helix transcriptional regulator [Brachybacterium huguangmaarense]
MSRVPPTSAGHPPDAEEPPLSPEDAEWADELAASWVEVYKKAATTLALLRLVRDHGPVSAQDVAPLFAQVTGWTLSERGLYRTLRRLAQAGSLEISQVEVPRTGARRQDFSLTGVGRAYLERIEDQLLR